ncbi:MAG: amino acid ABC transporter permease [Deltaproteobacteria bacterium]|nr:amino acid ABC transporter permease [Deltaproteobacteria bacterium]MBW2072136.1 amino acid ABC transporter permease [Deltaproteobacteria bacterium]
MPSLQRICRQLSKPPWSDVLKMLMLLGLFTWLLYRGSTKLGYHWQWHRVPRYLFSYHHGQLALGPLLQGLLVTFRVSGWGLVLTFAIGLVVALLRLSGSLVGGLVSRLYLEIIRNTPLLVQLFFVYFVLAPLVGLDRFAAAVLALSLFEGSYASEIFRAGIASIHSGQWEAAYSLGLGTYHTYRYVILPQAVRRILPPLTSQAVSLVKDSALVSTIAVYDLTMRAQEVISETFLTFEIWFTVAAMYLLITVTLSSVVNILEHRLRVAD